MISRVQDVRLVSNACYSILPRFSSWPSKSVPSHDYALPARLTNSPHCFAICSCLVCCCFFAHASYFLMSAIMCSFISTSGMSLLFPVHTSFLLFPLFTPWHTLLYFEIYKDSA